MRQLAVVAAVHAAHETLESVVAVHDDVAVLGRGDRRGVAARVDGAPHRSHRQRAEQQSEVRVRQRQALLAVAQPRQRVALEPVERPRRASAASRAEPRAPTRRAHRAARLETSPAQARQLRGVGHGEEGRDAEEPSALRQVARRAESLALTLDAIRGDRVPRIRVVLAGHPLLARFGMTANS